MEVPAAGGNSAEGLRALVDRRGVPRSARPASRSRAFFNAETLAVGTALLAFRGFGFQPALRFCVRKADRERKTLPLSKELQGPGSWTAPAYWMISMR
jgi:hypothetical protein